MVSPTSSIADMASNTLGGGTDWFFEVQATRSFSIGDKVRVIFPGKGIGVGTLQ